MNSKRLTRTVWAAALLALSSCATYQRTDLYFGRNIPTGGTVSDAQWKHFSDSVISAHFPEGYTEWDANGRWKDPKTHQTISEPSKVVTFVGKKSKVRSARVDSIAQSYVRLFSQQSVMRTDSKTRLQFLNQ